MAINDSGPGARDNQPQVTRKSEQDPLTAGTPEENISATLLDQDRNLDESDREPGSLFFTQILESLIASETNPEATNFLLREDEIVQLQRIRNRISAETLQNLTAENLFAGSPLEQSLVEELKSLLPGTIPRSPELHAQLELVLRDIAPYLEHLQEESAAGIPQRPQGVLNQEYLALIDQYLSMHLDAIINTHVGDPVAQQALRNEIGAFLFELRDQYQGGVIPAAPVDQNLSPPLPGQNFPGMPAGQSLYPIPEIADILSRMQPHSHVHMTETDAIARHLLPYARREGYVIEEGQLREMLHLLGHRYEGITGEVDRVQLALDINECFSAHQGGVPAGQDQFQTLVIDLIIRINAAQRGVEPPAFIELPEGFQIEETSERVTTLTTLESELESLGTELANAEYDNNQERVREINARYNSLLYDNSHLIPEGEAERLYNIFSEAAEREREDIPLRLDQQREQILQRIQEQMQALALQEVEDNTGEEIALSEELDNLLEELSQEADFEEIFRRVPGLETELRSFGNQEFTATVTELRAEAQEALDRLLLEIRELAADEANELFQDNFNPEAEFSICEETVESFEQIQMLQRRFPDLECQLQAQFEQAFAERLLLLQSRDRELLASLPTDITRLARREGEILALLESDGEETSLASRLGEDTVEALQAELEEVQQQLQEILNPEDGGPFTGEELLRRNEIINFLERHPEFTVDGERDLQALYELEKERGLQSIRALALSPDAAIAGYEQQAIGLINLLRGEPEPTEAQLLATLYQGRLCPEALRLVSIAFEERMGITLNEELQRIVTSSEGREVLENLLSGDYGLNSFLHVLEGTASIPEPGARRVEILRLLYSCTPEQISLIETQLAAEDPPRTLTEVIQEAGGAEVVAWLHAYRNQNTTELRAIELYLLLSVNPPRHEAALALLQQAGASEGPGVASAFHERYDRRLIYFCDDSIGDPSRPRLPAAFRPFVVALISGDQRRVDSEGLLLVLGLRQPPSLESVQLTELHQYLQSLPEERQQQAVEDIAAFVHSRRSQLLDGISFSPQEQERLEDLEGGSLRDYIYIHCGRDIERTRQILMILRLHGETPPTGEDVLAFERQQNSIQLLMTEVVELTQRYEGEEFLLQLYRMNLSQAQFDQIVSQFRIMTNEDLMRSLQLVAGEDNLRALNLLRSGNRVAFVAEELNGLLELIGDNPILYHGFGSHYFQGIYSYITGNASDLPIDRATELIQGLSLEELRGLNARMELGGTLDLIGGSSLRQLAELRLAGRTAEASTLYLNHILSTPGNANSRAEQLLDFLRSLTPEERRQLSVTYEQTAGESLETALSEQTFFGATIAPAHIPLIRLYLQGTEEDVQRAELFQMAGLYGGSPDFARLNMTLAALSPAERISHYRELEQYAEEHLEEVLQSLDPPLTAAQREMMNSIDRGPLGQLLFIRCGRNAIHTTQLLQLFGMNPGEGPLSREEMIAYVTRMTAASELIQRLEQGMQQEGDLQLTGDGVNSFLIITNADPEVLRCAESIYIGQQGTSFQDRLREAVPDPDQRACLDAFLAHGRAAAVAERIRSMSAQGRNIENGNLIRLWLERLSAEEVQQVQTLLQQRDSPLVLNTLLETIGGADLATWTSAHISGDIALRDAVQLHMIIGSGEVNVDAFGQFVNQVGNERFRAALTRYQTQYEATAEDIVNRMPPRHRELARAYLEGNSAAIERETVFIALGLRGGTSSPVELQRMNLVLAGMSPGRREELLQEARDYALAHYEDLLRDNPALQAQARPGSNSQRALENIMLVALSSNPSQLSNADNRQFVSQHRDRILSMFEQPIAGETFARYITTYEMIAQRQSQYVTVESELSQAIQLNRDRASGQWRMVSDTQSEIDDWNLSASIPGWNYLTGSGALYDSLVARRGMLQNHARQYDTLVRNLSTTQTQAGSIINNAQEAELQALNHLWHGRAEQAQQHLQTSNQQFGALVTLMQSDQARTSPNYAAMMQDLRQDSARFQTVINHCNRMETYIGYARTGLAVVGGVAVIVVSGGTATPMVAALYVTGAMAAGELTQAGLEIANGGDPGNVLLRAAGRTGMNFINSYGGASFVRSISTVTLTTGRTVATNQAGQVVSREVVMQQGTIRVAGLFTNTSRTLTTAGQQSLANPNFAAGSFSQITRVTLGPWGGGSGVLALTPTATNVWQQTAAAPPSRPVIEDEGHPVNPTPPHLIPITGSNINVEPGEPARPLAHSAGSPPTTATVEFRPLLDEVETGLTPPPVVENSDPPEVTPVVPPNDDPPATPPVDPPAPPSDPDPPAPPPDAPSNPGSGSSPDSSDDSDDSDDPPLPPPSGGGGGDAAGSFDDVPPDDPDPDNPGDEPPPAPDPRPRRVRNRPAPARDTEPTPTVIIVPPAPDVTVEEPSEENNETDVPVTHGPVLEPHIQEDIQRLVTPITPLPLKDPGIDLNQGLLPSNNRDSLLDSLRDSPASEVTVAQMAFHQKRMQELRSKDIFTMEVNVVVTSEKKTEDKEDSNLNGISATVVETQKILQQIAARNREIQSQQEATTLFEPAAKQALTGPVSEKSEDRVQVNRNKAAAEQKSYVQEAHYIAREEKEKNKPEANITANVTVAKNSTEHKESHTISHSLNEKTSASEIAKESLQKEQSVKPHQQSLQQGIPEGIKGKVPGKIRGEKVETAIRQLNLKSEKSASAETSVKEALEPKKSENGTPLSQSQKVSLVEPAGAVQEQSTASVASEEKQQHQQKTDGKVAGVSSLDSESAARHSNERIVTKNNASHRQNSEERTMQFSSEEKIVSEKVFEQNPASANAKVESVPASFEKSEISRSPDQQPAVSSSREKLDVASSDSSTNEVIKEKHQQDRPLEEVLSPAADPVNRHASVGENNPAGSSYTEEKTASATTSDSATPRAAVGTGKKRHSQSGKISTPDDLLKTRGPELIEKLFTTWAVERGLTAPDIIRLLSPKETGSSNSSSSIAASLADKKENAELQPENTPGLSNYSYQKNISALEEDTGRTILQEAPSGEDDSSSQKAPDRKHRRVRQQRRSKRKNQQRDEKSQDLILLQLLELLASRSRRDMLDEQLLLQLISLVSPELSDRLDQSGLKEILAEQKLQKERMMQQNAGETEAASDSERKEQVSRAVLFREIMAAAAVKNRLEGSAGKTSGASVKSDVLRQLHSTSSNSQQQTTSENRHPLSASDLRPEDELSHTSGTPVKMDLEQSSITGADLLQELTEEEDEK